MLFELVRGVVRLQQRSATRTGARSTDTAHTRRIDETAMFSPRTAPNRRFFFLMILSTALVVWWLYGE
jgi:hypothetical protein